MKNILKYCVAAVMALMAIVVAAEINENGSGTRIDFLNNIGKRLKSTTTYWNGSGVFLFDVRKDDGTFRVSEVNSGLSISKMVFTPYDTEREYPVTIKSENNEVEVSFQVIDDTENLTGGPVKKGGRVNIPCGTLLKLIIKVPHQALPTLKVLEEYTRPSSLLDGFLFSAEYNLRNVFSFSGKDCTDMNARQNVVRDIDAHGGFIQDENNPDVWYKYYWTENEPMTFTASCVKLGGKELRVQTNCALMSLYMQDQSYYFNNPFPNGEPYIMNAVGEYPSQDFIAGGLSIDSQSASSVMDLSLCTGVNTYRTVIPWVLCFKYITLSNLIMWQLDSFPFATDDERAIARAQMLVLRSHGYWRLLQTYGPRWSESNGGSTLIAPLETTFNTENQPAVSMKEIADQCYSDLDEAIDIFSRNKYERRDIIEPNLEVAKGVKMRLALLREDWVTAETISRELIQDLELTTNEELTSGFFKPAKSWIWGAWNNFDFNRDSDLEDYQHINHLYYWSYQNFFACNGTYPVYWNMGSCAIDKTLYDSMDEKDIRRSMYVMPDQVAKEMPGRVYSNLGDWYDSSLIDENKLFLTSDKIIKTYFDNNKPEGVEIPAFRTKDLSNILSGPVSFGAQHKFYQPGDKNFYATDAAVCFMRAEEVLLTHAEAALMAGKEVEAIADLNKLNSIRIENYPMLTQGIDLMSEIRKARKIELWGEGHSWFDQKRWKLPMTRMAWEANNENSGNWPVAMAIQTPLTAANGWRYMIPITYLNQNPLVTPDKLGYKDVDGYEPATVAQKRKDAKAKELSPAFPLQPSKEFVKNISTAIELK